MRAKLSFVHALLACLAVAATASAQFGHPLKGTWSGDWGPNKDNRTRILLQINWDGKALTGAINPGPDAVTMEKVSLDPSNWAVRIEADGKNRSGAPVHYVIEGKLQNIGAYQRFMTGTWTEGTVKGDFKVTRN